MVQRRDEAGLPAALDAGRARFEEWRANRETRRIPEELWKLAEGLGREFGVHRTAKALRLNHDSLRGRVTGRVRKAGGRVPPAVRAVERKPTFVELVKTEVGPKANGPAEGVVEIESVQGARLRVSWRGQAPDLARLSRSFLFGDAS